MMNKNIALVKKIALVTCYFQPNYGSQLQAFATQKFFDNIKVVNETILIDGLKPEINRAKYKYFMSRAFNLSIIKDKWATIKKVLAIKSNLKYSANLKVRYQIFDDFVNNNFHLSRKYLSFKDLSDSADIYSAFVVGSDQLWLPSNIAADYYTLSFVPNHIPTISLATSFGVSQLPKAQANKAKEFLPKIDYCSVREISGQKLIKDLIGKDVPVVCDPTILLTTNEWSNEIEPQRFINEKYILCYFLGNNPNHRDFVKKVKDLMGYKIVQLQHCDEFISSDEKFPDLAPYNVGPKEFVRLIRDAEYVFTDSFHCSVFSMLFSKKFFTFRRYNSDSIVSTNGRIYSLLSLVGEEKRLLKGDENPKNVIKMEINYVKVHEKLNNLRNFTKNFIYNALDNSNIHYVKSN